MSHDFCATGMVLVLVHHLAKFCFHLREGFPPVLRPFTEAGRELRQGDAPFTPVDELLSVLVTGAGFQRRPKIGQSPTLLIQIVIGIAHAEVPAMVACKIFLMGFQQGNRLLEHLPIPWLCQIVIGLGQFTVLLRCAFGDGLQGIDDFLVFIVFVPNLALL